MTEKYISKTLKQDAMSKAQTITVKIPPLDGFDFDDLQSALRAQNTVTQSIRPTELSAVKDRIDFEQLKKAGEYSPKFSGHFL